MNDTRPLVSVVDDNVSIRESLPDLLKFFGFSVATFASAKEFLDPNTIGETQCLILDVVMPGMTGSELHRESSIRGTAIPITFITVIRDDAARNRLIKSGSVDCLYKPFSDESVHDAVKTALRHSRACDRTDTRA
jgi:FixJ family two-component response regulator